MALHTFIMTFFLFLASVCHGKPVDTSVGASHLVGRDQYSFCDVNTTYVDETIPWESPPVEDCREMIDLIQGGGVYSVTLDGNGRELLYHKECHIVFQGTASGSPTINVGNGDIITYVEHTLEYPQFSSGRVAAYGITRCRKVDAPNNSADNMFSVRWDVS